MDNNRSGGVRYRDDIIIVSNLIPNYRYNVRLDMKTFKEPVWLPKYEEFSFISDPNSVKNIDVPCVSTGIVEGSVRRMVNGKVEPQNRIRIHIVNEQSDVLETVPVFSDGSFYRMGIAPGKYRAYIDSLQLSILDVKSEPKFIVFEVKTSANGDYIGDLNFILHPTTTPDDEEYEFLPVDGVPTERIKLE